MVRAGWVPVDHDDAAFCRACGGRCCVIYRYEDIVVSGMPGGRALNDGLDFIGCVEDWDYGFELSGALASGVAPLHDPLKSHLTGPAGDAYRGTLPGWVDADRCQYCHPESGCLLPRASRPAVCLDYRCDDWLRRGGAGETEQA